MSGTVTRAAWANDRHGWKIVNEFVDHIVTGGLIEYDDPSGLLLQTDLPIEVDQSWYDQLADISARIDERLGDESLRYRRALLLGQAVFKEIGDRDMPERIPK